MVAYTSNLSTGEAEAGEISLCSRLAWFTLKSSRPARETLSQKGEQKGKY